MKKFQVVKIKSGYAVQNVNTYTIAFTTTSRVKAEEVAAKLNG